MTTTRLSTLGSELEVLEAETFEVLDYTEFDEQLADGCSTSSTSTSSTCSSTSSTSISSSSG